MSFFIYLFLLFAEDFGAIDSGKGAVWVGFSWFTLKFAWEFFKVRGVKFGFINEMFGAAQVNLCEMMCFKQS